MLIVVAFVLTELRRLLIFVRLLLIASTAPLFGIFVSKKASPTNLP